MKQILLVCLVGCLISGEGVAATVEWNLKSKYGGITQGAIARAIADAKAHFATDPDDTVVIQFDAGTYYLSAPSGDSRGIFELSGVKPGAKGRLVFRGAGMDATTLVFDPAKDQIYGRGVYRVSFIGFHMTRKDYCVSQGHVAGVGPGWVDLEIQSGFPTPKDIYEANYMPSNPDTKRGRFLRRFTDSRTDPQIVVDDNQQYAWADAELVSGRRWRMNLVKRMVVANYKTGDLIGIKSKHGGQTYWLSGGSDFVFEDIKWTQVSRGVFRNGFDKIRITRCVVERSRAIEGQVPCLSTPDGGPQIGQPNDAVCSGIVEDCRMTGTGDDAVAFHHATGVVRNCTIADSFARGILLNNSPTVALENNTLVRCPVVKR